MSWFDALLGVGGALGGALIGSNANQRAAETAANANRDAAQITADAQRQAAQTYADAQARGYDQYKALVDQAIAEATAYNARAQQTYGNMAAESAPAVSYLRSVAFSNPYQLTPQQQTARENTIRDANARLAASGLRGAGRSGIATVNKAAQDFDDSAWTSNRARADSAATTLYNENVNAQGNIAATDRTTGATRANLLSGQGTAAMNAAQNTGNFVAGTQANIGNNSAGMLRDTAQTDANAGLRDAGLWGTAIGAIGSVLSRNEKDLYAGYRQLTGQGPV